MYQDKNGIYVSELKQDISYPESGNEQCFRVEKNSFWFNQRNSVIYEIIQKFPFQNNFVDIGGGNGYQANFIQQKFSDKKIFLIEPGYEGCLKAKNYGVKNIYNIPFQEFDFIGNNIGGVGLFDVIEHIENDSLFLQEIAKSSNPGTLIYVTVPAYQSLWSDTDDYAGHYRRYNKNMIKSLAKKSDLNLIYSGYFMFYLPLPIYFFKHLPYKFRGKRDNDVLLKNELNNLNSKGISTPIINLLNAIEIGSIRNFGKLIFGGSCIFFLQTK